MLIKDGIIDVVLDTDTYNEADDQYAISYMVRHKERFNVLGLYAAPFFNKRVSSPEEGMERSFEEILTLLKLLHREDLNSVVYRGSADYLKSEKMPQESDACDALIKLAMEHDEENPLYVIGIACITNIASAIIKRPEICNRIVVVWLGGHRLDWQDNKEFNLKQDIAAARVVFESPAPLALVPCNGVVSAFAISKPEVEKWFKGKGKLSDYLADELIRTAEAEYKVETWVKPIWDVTAVAFLLPGFTDSYEIEAPIPGYDNKWHFEKNRKKITYVYNIRRNELMQDLISIITEEEIRKAF